MKIVYSPTYGGFGLSEEAVRRLRELENPWAVKVKLPGETNDKMTNLIFGMGFNGCHDIPRDDQDLISIVQLMGTVAASGRFAMLKIVDIPDDVQWEVEDYDGNEWIAEKHRTWG